MSMHRTSIEWCRDCIYATIEDKRKMCNYLLDTKKLRNCEVGWCDKKVIGKRDKLKTFREFKIN